MFLAGALTTRASPTPGVDTYGDGAPWGRDRPSGNSSWFTVAVVPGIDQATFDEKVTFSLKGNCPVSKAPGGPPAASAFAPERLAGRS